MNGVVRAVGDDGFAVGVRQSFGNCPKYIQARKPEYIGCRTVPESAVHRDPTLDEPARAMIVSADTFFIATAYPARDIETQHGVDVSHRGGKPGFVKIAADDSLTVPDFAGNLFFNTLGNLAVHPLAGLLFIDFKNGDLLYLAVSARIILDAEEIERHEGAERLLRFEVKEMLRIEAALPLRWGEAELSPILARMGSNQVTSPDKA
jgi:predicted pyridoxine 5'-phosphate oxidase superfamily flavin-nucleotide-binding protein